MFVLGLLTGTCKHTFSEWLIYLEGFMECLVWMLFHVESEIQSSPRGGLV
jgi:hypothetical protein